MGNLSANSNAPAKFLVEKAGEMWLQSRCPIVSASLTSVVSPRAARRREIPSFDAARRFIRYNRLFTLAMQGTLLIIPGWQNSGPRHWQSLWQARMRNARRVEQRDWQTPQRADWISELDRAIAAAAAPLTLVAHSLGCITVAHWAALADASLFAKIEAALLVAPADVERADAMPETRNFAPIPRAPLPFRSLVVASENDLYCDLERAREFARAWGSDFVNLGRAGHLNTDAGFGEWREGERLLEQLTAMKVQP